MDNHGPDFTAPLNGFYRRNSSSLHYVYIYDLDTWKLYSWPKNYEHALVQAVQKQKAGCFVTIIQNDKIVYEGGPE